MHIQKNQNNRIFIAHFVLWLVLSVWVIGHTIIPMLEYGSPFGIVLPTIENGYLKDGLKIVDFPFHFNFVQKVWRHETTVSSGSSIYSVENHLKVTSDWAGQKVGQSLHFGYSPTMVWILAPLAPFSHATAYLIFNVAGLFAIFWLTRPNRCRWGIGLLLFFSPLAQICFVLGQTSLLTGAGLLYLAEKNWPDTQEQGWLNPLIGGSVLWALTAKPPIALTAALVLMSMRRWRPVIAAAIFTVISTLIISPWLGPNWMNDYVHLLRAYNLIDAGPVFSWSISPGTMANLRAIMSVDFGFSDNIASYVSSIVWLIVLAFLTILGLRFRLSAAALWSMGILSYLIFCPHVGSTEVLQALVILSLFVSPKGKLSWHELALFITLPFLVFISPISGFFYAIPLPLFLAQLFLFFFIFMTCSKNNISLTKAGV